MLLSRIKKHAQSESVGPLDDLRAFYRGSTHRWGLAALAVIIPLLIGVLFLMERHPIPYRQPDLTYVRMLPAPGEDDSRLRAFEKERADQLKALQEKADKKNKENREAAKRIDDSLKSWHLK